jgi:hypothetical protein
MYLDTSDCTEPHLGLNDGWDLLVGKARALSLRVYTGLARISLHRSLVKHYTEIPKYMFNSHKTFTSRFVFYKISKLQFCSELGHQIFASVLYVV